MNFFLFFYAEILLLPVCVSGSISGGYSSDSDAEVTYQAGLNKVLLNHRVQSIGATFEVLKPKKPFLKCTGNARGSAGACLAFPANPNFAGDITDLPRYAACRLGCDEVTPTCDIDTPTVFFACSSSYDLSFRCSSGSNRDELQQLIDALEDEGYFDYNCGFDTSFDMQYLLGDYCLDMDTDGSSLFYKLLENDCATEVETFDTKDDLFKSEHDSAFEAFLKATASVVPSYDASKYTDAKIGSCTANSDPFVSPGTSRDLFHCKLSGNGIGGQYFFRFGDQGDRDTFCNAMTAIRDAKWLQVGLECYNFPPPVVNSPFIPPDCDSSATLETATVRSSCKEHKDNGEDQDGFYIIDPPILDPGATRSPFAVYCDQTRDYGTGQVGGWTLFANGNDNSARVEKDVVATCEYSVSTAAHWRALVLNMNVGMAFRDEHDNLSFISSYKLITLGNCSGNIKNQASLMGETVPPGFEGQGKNNLWWHERSGCSGSGLDYSMVNLADRCSDCNSIFNYGDVKFDTFPYSGQDSYTQQNELRYFIS